MSDKSRYIAALAGMHKPVQTYVGNNPFNVAQHKVESATDKALAKGKLKLQEAQIANANNAGKLDIARVNMLKDKHAWEKSEHESALKSDNEFVANIGNVYNTNMPGFTEDITETTNEAQTFMSAEVGEKVNSELLNFRKNQASGSPLTTDEQSINKRYKSIIAQGLPARERDAQLLKLMKDNKEFLDLKMKNDKLVDDSKMNKVGSVLGTVHKFSSPLNMLNFSVSNLRDIKNKAMMTDEEYSDYEKSKLENGLVKNEIDSSTQFENAKYKLDKIKSRSEQLEASKETRAEEEKKFTEDLVKKYGSTRKIPITKLVTNVTMERDKASNREQGFYSDSMKRIQEMDINSATKLKFLEIARKQYEDRMAKYETLFNSRMSALEKTEDKKQKEKDNDVKLGVAGINQRAKQYSSDKIFEASKYKVDNN